MSSELIELDSDCHNHDISIAMNANGTLFISISEEDEVVTYTLPPDEASIDKAKSIAKALLYWSEDIVEKGLIT